MTNNFGNIKVGMTFPIDVDRTFRIPSGAAHLVFEIVGSDGERLALQPGSLVRLKEPPSPFPFVPTSWDKASSVKAQANRIWKLVDTRIIACPIRA